MEILCIPFVIIGVILIGMAIFGKFRPDIIYKNILTGELQSPEIQRYRFIAFLLMGITFLMIAVAISVPQWEAYQFEIFLTILMVMTVVSLLLCWKIVLSQNEKSWVFSLILVVLISVAMLSVAAYFWYIRIP